MMASLSAEKLEQTVSAFYRIANVLESSPETLQAVPVSLIQQACSLLDIITSHMPIPATLDASVPQTKLTLCSNVKQLECVLSLMLKIVSVFPLVDDKDRQYWCWKLLESAYQCFKVLRVHKLLQLTDVYSHDILQCLSGCLVKLQTKSTSVPMLLLLLRIVYAFTSQRLPQSLDVIFLANSLVPYFRHCDRDVRVAARNAGQSIICVISETEQQMFILDASDVRDIVCSFGKQMPISSSLRLILSFCQLAENRRLILNEGILLLAVSTAVLSRRPLEKNLAFQVIKILCMEWNTQKTKSKSDGKVSHCESPVLKGTITTQANDIDQMSSHLGPINGSTHSNPNSFPVSNKLSSSKESGNTNPPDPPAQQQADTKLSSQGKSRKLLPQDREQMIGNLPSQHSNGKDSFNIKHKDSENLFSATQVSSNERAFTQQQAINLSQQKASGTHTHKEASVDDLGQEIDTSEAAAQILLAQKYLTTLAECADTFKAVVFLRDIADRNSFTRLKDTLDKVQEVSVRSQLCSHSEVFQRLFNLLLSIVCNFLQALMVTDEKQHQKWCNYILFTSWDCLKFSEKESFTEHQALTILDGVLEMVTKIGRMKRMDQVFERSLQFCLGVLEDLLYSDLGASLTQQPLMAVRETLLDGQVLLVPSCKPKAQMILCYFVSDEDEVAKHLCISPSIVSKYLKPRLTSDDAREVMMTLKQVKALANVFRNRQLLRQCGILQLLEDLAEKFTSSVTETYIAELICSLLSDPSDLEEDTSPFPVLDEFLSAAFEGLKTDQKRTEDSQLDIISMEDFITNTSSEVCSKQPPDAVLLHAKHIYELVGAAKKEFQYVLHEAHHTIKVTFLIQASKHLGELCKIYESCTDLSWQKLFGEQVVFLFRRHLPELSCVSFKAMKDVYSNTMSDIDKVAFSACLKEFLQYLHWCIETWSRMGATVQWALVDHGAFHLLLNEFHTASTTMLVTQDILYTAVTSLFNVVLDPNLAVRFRIVVTKKLLKPFLSTADVGMRCITKFSLSCMHELHSRSELNQIKLDSVEVSMLARCLNGVDTFFGGKDNLLLTIENLARIPSTWQLFVNAGVVHTLASLILSKEGFTRKHALKALLNMIPEPEIAESDAKGKDVNKQVRNQPLTSPASNVFTRMSSLVDFIKGQAGDSNCYEICTAIQLLTSSLENPELESIEMLYVVERYPDCWSFCELLLSESDLSYHKSTRALLYQAKCLYHEYNRELAANLEMSSLLPGFEYKEMMRKFCNAKIVKVINILSSLRAQGALSSLNEDVIVMLDKALLDCLIFNTAEVQICLLCHTKAKKRLIHSHFIPKFLIHGLIKTMGLDPKTNIFIFSPTEHPSDWNLKSAAKLSFTMLCDTCDNQILSQDENNFKRFFSKIYDPQTRSVSTVVAHRIPYNQYLYRFAAGLMFRNIAPLFSEVCAEIGEHNCLLNLMHAYREVILNSGGTQLEMPKLYLLALPSELPSSMGNVQHWRQFVFTNVAPYAAYKLLQPGEPMVPKKLYCCMVKIGVLLFIAPFEKELEQELEKCNPCSMIQYKGATMTMLIPDNQHRAACIPQKLLWSLIGWAKKSMNQSMSIALSIKPPTLGIPCQGLLPENFSSSSAPIDLQANLLPPGFALNFDKPNTLPEKVVEVPKGHTILLHQRVQNTTDAQGYIILAKQEAESASKRIKSEGKQPKKGEKLPVYTTFSQPYVLVYLKHTRLMLTIKAGFFINVNDCQVTDILRGSAPSMKESEHVQKIVHEIPFILRKMLRSKGFRNLRSLLFWHESMMNAATDVTENKILCKFDTRCLEEKCIYCDMRCDYCLKPSLNCDKMQSFSGLGTVQTCSKACSDAMFHSDPLIKLQNMETSLEQFTPKGHVELLRCFFTYESKENPGLSIAVLVSVCQKRGGASEMKYIKLWHRNIAQPYCVEYLIDEQFCQIEMLSFEGSESEFSVGEEKEMIHQFHQILIKIGLPYHLAQLELGAHCTISP